MDDIAATFFYHCDVTHVIWRKNNFFYVLLLSLLVWLMCSPRHADEEVCVIYFFFSECSSQYRRWDDLITKFHCQYWSVTGFNYGVRCAAWEVWWTYWPHAPPQHIVPHHVIKECSSSFVLTSMALMELRAILHNMEWSLAWHFALPFSSKVILKQDLWPALSCIF